MSLGCAPSQCRVYIARMYLVVSMCIHFSTAVRAQAERVLNEWVFIIDGPVFDACRHEE